MWLSRCMCILRAHMCAHYMFMHKAIFMRNENHPGREERKLLLYNLMHSLSVARIVLLLMWIICYCNLRRVCAWTKMRARSQEATRYSNLHFLGDKRLNFWLIIIYAREANAYSFECVCKICKVSASSFIRCKCVITCLQISIYFKTWKTWELSICDKVMIWIIVVCSKRVKKSKVNASTNSFLVCFFSVCW